MGTYELVKKFNYRDEEDHNLSLYNVRPPIQGYKLVVVYHLSHTVGLYSAHQKDLHHYTLGEILYPAKGHVFPGTEEEIWEVLDYTEYKPSYTSPCSYEDVLL